MASNDNTVSHAQNLKMSETKQRRKKCLKVLRYLLILICTGGFIYQALEFMQLYWTYPTVVNIQKSEPSYVEVPAFTICNPLGYNYTTICEGFNVRPCLPSTLNKYVSKEVCNHTDSNMIASCFDGKIPNGYRAIIYNLFSETVYVKADDHDKLRLPLKDYFKCDIEFGGKKRKCNLDNVMGPFYSTDELPQYCYSIYSMWGKPNKERERIPKGSIMKFKFYVNASLSSETDNKKIRPKHNMPSSPSVQIAVHSPYTLPSPYLEGSNFLGGRAYDLRVSMSESHLLPSPYETNCTDYLTPWKRRGGKGPVNQMGIINECRMLKYYNALGCVPLTVDYPHNYSICKACREGCNYSVNVEECTDMAEGYNQPCDSLSYSVVKRNKPVAMLYKMKSKSLTNVKFQCTSNLFYTIECSTVDIDVIFDRFEITVTSYDPKLESLEIFSVIGGYLGMWLGISLVTVYDFIGAIIEIATTYTKNRKDKRRGTAHGSFRNHGRRYHAFQEPDLSPDSLVTYRKVM